MLNQFSMCGIWVSHSGDCEVFLPRCDSVQPGRRSQTFQRSILRRGVSQARIRCLLLAGFSLGLLFYHDDGGCAFQQNVGELLWGFLLSPRRYSIGWALASWTICLHSSLFFINPPHPFTFILRRSHAHPPTISTWVFLSSLSYILLWGCIVLHHRR
jgi:hypothetical protein